MEYVCILYPRHEPDTKERRTINKSKYFFPLPHDRQTIAKFRSRYCTILSRLCVDHSIFLHVDAGRCGPTITFRFSRLTSSSVVAGMLEGGGR